jgi:hypothetical protein
MRDAAKGHATVDDDVRAVLDPARAVDRRDVVGGPARARVLRALDDAERLWSIKES